MIRKIAITALAGVLSACSSPSAKVQRLAFGSSDVLATTGNLRLVTERDRPGYPPVVCTEPSPDYAVEFGTSAKARRVVTTKEGVTGEASGDLTTTEDVTELKGRSAAVLALRDGLYAACQAYANGVIGHDAYSIVLSQYGTLLVALVAGEGGTAASGKAAGVATQSAAAGRQATAAALVVACIGAHDHTRLPATVPNPLLSEGFCRGVLKDALDASLRT